jgi:uncharacterized protein YcaQ
VSDIPEVSATEARRYAIGGTGLAASRPRKVRPEHVVGVLEHLGALQLDTISTLARAHELVPAARLGHFDRGLIDRALWGTPGGVDHPGPVRTVEYWAHAACVLPVRTWPSYAFRRRDYVRRGKRWHELTDAAIDLVRAGLAEGPITTGDLGGAKSSSEWWDWSESKIAIEWLLDIGEVVCVRRTGWRRVYDFAARALPAEVQGGTGWVEVDGIFGPTDAACHDALIEAAALTLGVGTVADLADVPRLNQAQTKAAISRLIERGRLQQVSVHTWVAPAYMHLEPRAPGTRRRAVLLSPFDPLVWERARTERMFGMRYRIESYTPAPKRERGYYAMPVLAGDRLVGTVDPARTDKGATLTARTVVVEAEKESRAATHRDALAIAAALADAASWVGAERIEVEQVRPASARAAVVQAVSEISSRIKP